MSFLFDGISFNNPLIATYFSLLFEGKLGQGRYTWRGNYGGWDNRE